MTPHTTRARILAIDPGERRIGVAAADPSTGVALPLTAIEAGPDPVEAIARLVEEQGATELVVGLALSMSGALGPQGQRGQALAKALGRRLDIPVHTWDERLSSSEARRRAPAGGKGRPKGALDAAAAAIILQAFLDSRRAAERRAARG
jgi:putative Holliday junction resolvase